MTTIQFDIGNGPNADRVLDGLKYAFNDSVTISTVFTVRKREAQARGTLSWQLVDVQIIGVSYESGVPGMFLLKVNIPGFNSSTGYYNANTRQGVFYLEPST